MLGIADDKANVRCMACNGELEAGCVGLPCPHCGELIENLVDGEVVDLDEMAVREDAYCRGCGYNLRTLAVLSQCPECGGQVADSIAQGNLCHSDQHWLKLMQSGTEALLVGMIFLPVGLLVAFVNMPCCVVVFVFIGSLLWLTSGSMRIAHVDPRLQARVGTPWPNLFATILPFSIIAAIFAGNVNHSSVVTIVIGVAIAVNIVAVGLCLKALADRQGRRRLAKCTIVIFAATAIVVCALFALDIAEAALRFGGLGSLCDVITKGGFGLLGVCGVATFWVILRINTMLSKARKAAKRVQGGESNENLRSEI